jgi:hypothetical protein
VGDTTQTKRIMDRGNAKEIDMSKVSVEFQFEIGELVYFKAAAHNSSHRPRRFVIYERHVQECSGGVQKLYRLDGCDRLAVEIVLTTKEPPYRPISEEEIAQRIELVRAETVAQRWAYRDAATKKVTHKVVTAETKGE